MDDGQEQDQYEERLKELFDSFDSDGVGSLCREELSALCQSLQLDSATPSLFQTLLRDDDDDMARVSPFPWARLMLCLLPCWKKMELRAECIRSGLFIYQSKFPRMQSAVGGRAVYIWYPTSRSDIGLLSPKKYPNIPPKKMLNCLLILLWRVLKKSYIKWYYWAKLIFIVFWVIMNQYQIKKFCFRRGITIISHYSNGV